MPWGKFTDELHENDKVGSVSDAAFRLWVLSITWSNKTLTDGHVPTSRPVRLMTLKNSKKTIAELIEARLWHHAARPCVGCLDLRRRKGVTDPIPPGGYLIHDYHGFQPAAWKVIAERERMRELGRVGGVKSGQSRSKNEIEGEDDEALRSSATLQPGEEASKRSGQAQRSTPVPP